MGRESDAQMLPHTHLGPLQSQSRPRNAFSGGVRPPRVQKLLYPLGFSNRTVAWPIPGTSGKAVHRPAP